MKVKIKKLNEEVKTPQYKTIDAACADLSAYFKHTPKEEFKYIPNREYVFKRISDYYDEKLEKVVLDKINIAPGDRVIIPTGVFLELPKGYEAKIRNRSGLSFKEGLFVIEGTIDADYRGELGIIVTNIGKEVVVVHNGDRIAQLKIQVAEQAEFEEVEDLSDTERGEGGFGHTGK